MVTDNAAATVLRIQKYLRIHVSSDDLVLQSYSAANKPLSILYHYHTSGGMQFGWRGPGEPHAQQKHIILDGICCNDSTYGKIYNVMHKGTVCYTCCRYLIILWNLTSTKAMVLSSQTNQSAEIKHCILLQHAYSHTRCY